MDAHEKRNGALRTLLGAPDEDLVAVVETKLDQIRMAERRLRNLEEELATTFVQALAGKPGRLVDHHFDGKEAAFLQRAARQLVMVAPGKVAFFTATSENGSFFVLAAGEASGFDVVPVGREIAELLEAKGGGAKGFFQGKALNLARRDMAVARLG